MCGLVGWIDFTRDLTRERATLDAMTATMERRGPDAGGTWLAPHAGLGHRRLAVIDIEGGTQPFPSGSTDATLVYSGEVYNFRELRATLKARGHVFTTRSDTEVVLRAYEEWGIACVDHFNGMFAFAVWDGAKEQLLLARDRLGVKPLYYHAYDGGILFASEPKGILANPLFRPEIDEHSLIVLLNPRLALPGETPMLGLREVKPGHVVVFDRRGASETPYWRLVSAPHEADMETTARATRELLEDIVERQLVADVPRAAMLSGGIDSTTIAAIASQALDRTGEGPLNTFSVEFAGDDRDFKPSELRPEPDGPYARIAAKHIGSEHTSVVLETKQLTDTLPLTRRARDLPGWAQFDSSIYLLFEEIRAQSTVALSGEAADEVFGGYPWFHSSEMVWRDRFPWMGDAPRLADCLAPDIARRIKPAETEQDRYQMLRAEVPRLDGESGLDARMREVLYFSLKGPLAVLLDRKDRLSMAVGLEVRVPFCDHRLVEYAWNIPWSMKAENGEWKAVLRRAAADLLPAETLDRRKSGYPGTHDPAYDEHTIASVRGFLADRDAPLHGLLDRARLDAFLENGATTMTYMNAAHMLLPLIEIDAWMRDYGVTMR